MSEDARKDHSFGKETAGWAGGEGAEAQGRGGMCAHRADLRCGMAETSTTLGSNYPPIKNKWKESLVRPP